MSPKKATISIIVVSLVFAALIVIGSVIFADTAHSQTVTFMLIAIWFVPFTYLIAARKTSD